jgi:hypothetical protein
MLAAVTRKIRRERNAMVNPAMALIAWTFSLYENNVSILSLRFQENGKIARNRQTRNHANGSRARDVPGYSHKISKEWIWQTVASGTRAWMRHQGMNRKLKRRVLPKLLKVPSSGVSS